VSLDGGSASDVYNIESTASGTPATVIGGGGNDTFNVTPTSENLSNIAGNLTLDGNGGTDSVNINDQSNTTASTYSVSSSSVSRTGSGTITYSLDENLTDAGGSGGNTFNVSGTASG